MPSASLPNGDLLGSMSQLGNGGEAREYGRGIERQAHFQAGLFETLLVALSIPWVNGQSVGANSMLGWGECVLLECVAC